MKNYYVFPVLFLSVLFSCKKEKDETSQATQTRTVTLQTDGYSSGSTKSFQAGFLANESAEVTLGPVVNTFQILEVSFLFGGVGNTPVTRDVVLRIYRDAGTSAPGTLLFTSTYPITSSDDNMQTIDLRSEQIKLDGGGMVRIALEMTANGSPSVAIDQDGTISAIGNWVKTGGNWVSGKSLGLTGDFIIRAKIEENI